MSRLYDRHVNVAAAARTTGQTPRMLRYREQLGLLAPRRSNGNNRTNDDADLQALRAAAAIESHYGVSPAAVAFAVRALHDTDLAARLRDLARLAHRPEPIAVLDFDTHKARRLLRLAS